MRLLITGGAGFIASHVIEHLLIHTDWNIVTLDRLDTSGNLNRLAQILETRNDAHRVKIIHHDLRASVNPLLRDQIGRVDMIWHLAAASHVDRSIEDPLSFVFDNVVGTCTILEYARQLPSLDWFLYFSTDEVFGPAPSGVAYKEWDRYHSANPYAATKAGAEELCLAFANTYGLPVTITHTMNVIGERQHPEKFVPSTIRKVRDGEKVLIHASKDLVPGSRFYIHARNVADALLFVYRQQPRPVKINIVGEQEVNNLDLARAIAIMQGQHMAFELIDFHSSRPGHDLRYALDGTALAELGWKPPVTFEESLRKTVEWTLKHPEWL